MKTLSTKLWMSFVLAAGACQSGGSSEPAPAPDPTATPTTQFVPMSVGPERPLQLVQHAVLAFRPKAGALVGGYQTHSATITPDGAITLTPYTKVGTERTAHSPMLLETAGIAVDSFPIAGAAAGTRLDNGSVLVERGGVTEKLTNLEDGIHQEWRFDAAPTFAGDLVVEVGVGNYRYAGSTASGLHFDGGADSGYGFRYSHAVWQSGDGSEWPIEATFDGDRIRMTIPEGIVEKTTFPAVLDPTVTAEVAADTAVAGFTGANSQNAAIAFSGTQYLVVWDDNRDSIDSDIWGSRISTTGAILDPLGIQIASNAGRQTNPAVTFDGSTFVVAWEDFKVAGGTSADIVAATVSTAGAVTALGTVAGTAASELQPQLAGGGGTSLLVWHDASSVIGALRTTGAFGAPIAVGGGVAAQVDPAVARNPGGDYLVAWSEGAVSTADLKGQFVTTAGALNGAAITISAGAGRQSTPSAAFDGTNFALSWTNNNAGINIFGARVSTVGAVLDTHTEGTTTGVGGITVSGAADNQDFSGIACLATGCTVIWQDRRNFATTGFDIMAQRLNPDFTLNGTELVVANATQNQFLPAIAASTTDFFGVWHDNRGGNAQTVFGATISTAGAVGTNNPLVGGNNRESAPHIGRAGGVFGIFWSDSRTFDNDIRYVRFSAAGAKLDSTALVASSAANAQLAPAASTDLGANTLVVWSDTRNGQNKDIFAARVSLSTGVVDANGIALTTAAGDQLVPDVASNGTVALAVWQDRRGAAFDIFGALIDSSGAVVAADIPISTATGDQLRPAVTFDSVSGQFIVVWSDASSGVSHINGARVSTAGAVLDTTPVTISSAAVGQFSPAIASGATNSLVVWEDRRAGQDIFGARVTGGASLTVLDSVATGINISSAAGAQTQPKVALVSGFFTVIWTDSRNTQLDIFGQQVDANGALAGTEFAITNTPDDESNGTITAGTSTQSRVAYETQRQHTRRVNTRLISGTSASGQICSGPTQCSTGFCVDGFCCNSACGGNHQPTGPRGSGIAGDCHACANKYTGQANGLCAPVAAGTTCRDYESTFCDLQELCDGVSTTCGADIGRRAGLACNKSSNFPPGVGTGVCPSAAAPGPHFCQ